MLQKTQIIGIEMPYVVDAVPQHRDSLRAHAECEAGVLIRVVADSSEHLRMHHSCAHDFKPAGLTAYAAALSAAAEAVNSHIHARLYERKEVAAKSHTTIRAKHAACKSVQRALEVRECDAAIDCKAFYLKEDGFMRGVCRLVSVDPARDEDADRGLVGPP